MVSLIRHTLLVLVPALPYQARALRACKTTTGTPCYLQDPQLFNRSCSAGDYCLDGVPYGGSTDSSVHACPLLDEIVRRGPFHMACIYLPHGQPLLSETLPPSKLLVAASGPGRWDCSRHLWQPQSTVVGVPAVTSCAAFDAVATYGDSIAHNVAMGLQIVLNGYRAGKFYHDRNHFIPTQATTGLPVAHFCCIACACGIRPVGATAVKLFEWARKINSRNLLLVARTSMHIRNDVKMMTAELRLLVERARLYKGNVTLLWVPQHGAGRRKDPKFLRIGQDTVSLRTYDAAVRVGVIGNATRAEIGDGVRTGVLDIEKMFHAAENECDGAYGSLDGTHLSPTVQVNVAQQILRLCLSESTTGSK